MLKQFAFGLVVVVAAAAPVRADLHYTMHTEAHQVTTTEPVNPLFGMVSDIMMRTMFPEGPIDTTYWISDKGTRVELTKGNVFAPAGAILLNLVDGGMLVLNPKEHTYWKLNLPEITPLVLTAIARLNPQAAVVHTGEFDTIAGVRAERLTSTTTMELPFAPAGMPGMPTSIATTTDSWNSDQYAGYADLAKSTANMMGLGGLIPEGFMLKSVMRNSMMPGFEIESVVTTITEEPAPAGAFEIPADYNEVPAPAMLGPTQPR